MKQKPDERIPVVVDTREQTPFFMHTQYDDRIVKIVRKLDAGDYSLVGFEDKIAGREQIAGK